MTSGFTLTLNGGALAALGICASVLLLALIEHLRRTFATRQELQQLRERLEALQGLCLQAHDAADEARECSGALERAQRHQWEMITAQVIRPLDRITHKLEGMGEAQVAQATVLQHTLQRLNRLDDLRPLPAEPR